MKFYNKYYANDFEELLTYYPRFYRDVYEMVEILKAQGKLADELEDNIEQVYFNCFIDYADEPTLAKLERFLDIGLNKSHTLEERRRLIKSFFVGFGKVSASLLEEMIKSYTGADVSSRFEPCDDEGNNMLYIELDRGDVPTLYMGDINLLLGKKIPAHIAWQAAITYPFPVGIGIRRKHYKFGYELTGTKPDIAMKGLALDYSVVTRAKARSYRAKYEQASKTEQTGTKPDIATIGSYLAIKDVVGAKAKIYTTEHKKAQNGDLGAGEWPHNTTIGKQRTVAGAVETESASLIADYEATGTKPDLAALAAIHSIVETIGTEVTSQVLDHEPAGIKPEAANLGESGEISAGTGVKSTDYSVNYIYCGTSYPQS